MEINKNKIIGFFKLTFIVIAINMIVSTIYDSIMWGEFMFPFYLLFNPLSLIGLSSPLSLIPRVVFGIHYTGAILNFLLVIVGWLVNYFISVKVFPESGNDKEPEATKENTNERAVSSSLTEKYKVLNSFKILLYILMIASTGFFIYSFGNLFDALNKAKGLIADQLGHQLISVCIAYTVNMFCLFCITKIIDFLFDLDKK